MSCIAKRPTFLSMAKFSVDMEPYVESKPVGSYQYSGRETERGTKGHKPQNRQRLYSLQIFRTVYESPTKIMSKTLGTCPERLNVSSFITLGRRALVRSDA